MTGTKADTKSSTGTMETEQGEMRVCMSAGVSILS